MSDDGRAYGRTAGHLDPELVEVGAGTPAGELLRRYWHPVGLSTDARNCRARVRLLGEDLVLYRIAPARPGC